MHGTVRGPGRRRPALDAEWLRLQLDPAHDALSGSDVIGRVLAQAGIAATPPEAWRSRRERYETAEEIARND